MSWRNNNIAQLLAGENIQKVAGPVLAQPYHGMKPPQRDWSSPQWKRSPMTSTNSRLQTYFDTEGKAPPITSGSSSRSSGNDRFRPPEQTTLLLPPPQSILIQWEQRESDSQRITPSPHQWNNNLHQITLCFIIPTRKVLITLMGKLCTEKMLLNCKDSNRGACASTLKICLSLQLQNCIYVNSLYNSEWQLFT